MVERPPRGLRFVTLPVGKNTLGESRRLVPGYFFFTPSRSRANTASVGTAEAVMTHT